VVCGCALPLCRCVSVCARRIMKTGVEGRKGRSRAYTNIARAYGRIEEERQACGAHPVLRASRGLSAPPQSCIGGGTAQCQCAALFSILLLLALARMSLRFFGTNRPHILRSCGLCAACVLVAFMNTPFGNTACLPSPLLELYMLLDASCPYNSIRGLFQRRLFNSLFDR